MISFLIHWVWSKLETQSQTKKPSSQETRAYFSEKKNHGSLDISLYSYLKSITVRVSLAYQWNTMKTPKLEYIPGEHDLIKGCDSPLFREKDAKFDIIVSTKSLTRLFTSCLRSCRERKTEKLQDKVDCQNSLSIHRNQGISSLFCKRHISFRAYHAKEGRWWWRSRNVMLLYQNLHFT